MTEVEVEEIHERPILLVVDAPVVTGDGFDADVARNLRQGDRAPDRVGVGVVVHHDRQRPLDGRHRSAETRDLQTLVADQVRDIPRDRPPGLDDAVGKLRQRRHVVARRVETRVNHQRCVGKDRPGRPGYPDRTIGDGLRDEHHVRRSCLSEDRGIRRIGPLGTDVLVPDGLDPVAVPGDDPEGPVRLGRRLYDPLTHRSTPEHQPRKHHRR